MVPVVFGWKKTMRRRKMRQHKATAGWIFQLPESCSGSSALEQSVGASHDLTSVLTQIKARVSENVPHQRCSLDSDDKPSQ